MNLNTPLLYIVYNRLDKVKLSFEKIKEVKPKALYIAADGPKDEVDKLKCDSVKKYITSNILWDCKLFTLYRDKNLGCKEAVKTGIDWFFSQVNEGIILEDDILSNHNFFHFCEELLEKYRNEDQVYSIGGTNILIDWPIKESYLFSMQGSIWGWATWKRAWNKYIEHSEINFNEQRKIEKYSIYKKVLIKRKENFSRVFNGQIDTWDYQWIFTRIINEGYCILPKVNLISNIGFDENATHTIKASNLSNLEPISFEFPLTHPKNVEINWMFEKKFVRTLYDVRPISSVLHRKLKNLISRLIK